jgi:hypothetical protein
LFADGRDDILRGDDLPLAVAALEHVGPDETALTPVLAREGFLSLRERNVADESQFHVVSSMDLNPSGFALVSSMKPCFV